MTPNAVEMPKFLAALTRTKPPADAVSCHKGYSTKSISFVPILLVKLLATAHYKFPSSPDYECIVSVAEIIMFMLSSTMPVAEKPVG